MVPDGWRENAPVMTPFATKQVHELVRMALDEDAVSADATSSALIPPGTKAQAVLEVRAPGVLCGMPLLDPMGSLLSAFPSVRVDWHLPEGTSLSSPADAASLSGDARELLGLERTLLNFLQRLSGIASMTARCVKELEGTNTRVQETRKTCPGWRTLDKYAVRTGGGLNHRDSLADQVLIKDNHITISGDRMSPEACVTAVRVTRDRCPGLVVEIEVETEAQCEAVLACGPDIIMLDGFEHAAIGRAVAMRKLLGAHSLFEVSGGLVPGKLRAIAELGVERVSIGALTHSVMALDMALKFRNAIP